MTEPTLAQRLFEARDHQREGRPEMAESLYRAILSDYPGHPEANYRLGRLLADSGKTIAALPWLRKALESNPALGVHWLAYAEALFNAGHAQAAQAILALGQARGNLDVPIEHPSPQSASDVPPAARPPETPSALVTTSRRDASRSIPKQETEPEIASAERQALVELFNDRRFDDAEALLHRLLDSHPADGFLWKMRGSILTLRGQSQEALEALSKAQSLNPRDAELSNTRGVALQNLGRLEEAADGYRRALVLAPDYLQAHYNLASVCKRLGQWDEAEASCREATRVAPSRAEVHSNLGRLLFEMRRFGEAESCYRRALELDPKSVVALRSLGSLLNALGRWHEAELVLREALTIAPTSSEAHNSLGNSLHALGRLNEAVASYREALTFDPALVEALGNLGTALSALGRASEAEACLRRALVIDPRNPSTCSNLGTALSTLGRTREAEAWLRRALTIDPKNTKIYSNLLFTTAYSGELSADRARLEAAGWERACLTPSERAEARKRKCNLAPRLGRPLRVGLLSAELGQHAVAYFLLPWLSALNRERVHIHLFPTRVRSEPLVETFRALADAWTPLDGLSDIEAAATIRAARIDILIDTSGHTAGNRLGVIAHRAAPVQCHYIGYFSTTGLTEMDWFLADTTLIPPTMDDQFTERVWRLTRPWMAYAPLEEAPQPDWLPDPEGTLWLGSFNNLTKVRDDCLKLWAQVLCALPKSRLLLKDRMAQDVGTRERVRRVLAQSGIESDRLVFAERDSTWYEHMARYNRVDIALDPIPMTGGSTAFDALWMGVPLVTLAGTRLIGRQGAAALTGLGRTEWIAHDAEEYVAIVKSLALDTETRRAVRETQRERMREGPLCDCAGMAQALEQAFEDMFDQMVASAPCASP